MRTTLACLLATLLLASMATAAPTDDVYKLGPDSEYQPGVPKGKITGPLTLESKTVPGLYLCGEMLDAFGPIGGHNFAWAWATGRAAGLAAGLSAVALAKVEPA